MIKIDHEPNSIALKILNPGPMGTIMDIKTVITVIPTPMRLLKIRHSFTKVRLCDQVRHTATRATKGHRSHQVDYDDHNQSTQDDDESRYNSG